MIQAFSIYFENVLLSSVFFFLLFMLLYDFETKKHDAIVPIAESFEFTLTNLGRVQAEEFGDILHPLLAYHHCLG